MRGGREGEEEGHWRMRVRGGGLDGGEGEEKKRSEKTLKILVDAVVPGEYSRQAAGSLHGEMALGMLTGTLHSLCGGKKTQASSMH